MSKYGPTKGEHRFRLAASLAGLAFLAGALAWQGFVFGPAMVEVLGFGGTFLLGSAVWSGWKLATWRDEE